MFTLFIKARVSHRDIHFTGVPILWAHGYHRRMPLTGVSLRGAHLTGVHLIGACISQGMHLMSMHLMGMHLIGVHLMNVPLSWASLASMHLPSPQSLCPLPPL